MATCGALRQSKRHRHQLNHSNPSPGNRGKCCGNSESCREGNTTMVDMVVFLEETVVIKRNPDNCTLMPTSKLLAFWPSISFTAT